MRTFGKSVLHLIVTFCVSQIFVDAWIFPDEELRFELMKSSFATEQQGVLLAKRHIKKIHRLSRQLQESATRQEKRKIEDYAAQAISEIEDAADNFRDCVQKIRQRIRNDISKRVKTSTKSVYKVLQKRRFDDCKVKLHKSLQVVSDEFKQISDGDDYISLDSDRVENYRNFDSLEEVPERNKILNYFRMGSKEEKSKGVENSENDKDETEKLGRRQNNIDLLSQPVFELVPEPEPVVTESKSSSKSQQKKYKKHKKEKKEKVDKSEFEESEEEYFDEKNDEEDNVESSEKSNYDESMNNRPGMTLRSDVTVDNAKDNKMPNTPEFEKRSFAPTRNNVGANRMRGMINDDDYYDYYETMMKPTKLNKYGRMTFKNAKPNIVYPGDYDEESDDGPGSYGTPERGGIAILGTQVENPKHKNSSHKNHVHKSKSHKQKKNSENSEFESSETYDNSMEADENFERSLKDVKFKTKNGKPDYDYESGESKHRVRRTFDGTKTEENDGVESPEKNNNFTTRSNLNQTEDAESDSRRGFKFSQCCDFDDEYSVKGVRQSVISERNNHYTNTANVRLKFNRRQSKSRRQNGNNRWSRQRNDETGKYRTGRIIEGNTNFVTVVHPYPVIVRNKDIVTEVKTLMDETELVKKFLNNEVKQTLDRMALETETYLTGKSSETQKLFLWNKYQTLTKVYALVNQTRNCIQYQNNRIIDLVINQKSLSEIMALRQDYKDGVMNCANTCRSNILVIEKNHSYQNQLINAGTYVVKPHLFNPHHTLIESLLEKKMALLMVIKNLLNPLKEPVVVYNPSEH